MRQARLVLALAAVSAIAVGSAHAALPLAPLSTLGKLTPAPAPGPTSLEAVPMAVGATLADPQAVKLNQTIDGVTCQSSEKVAFHIHVHLTIFVDGKAKQVPFGIGIGQQWGGVREAGHGSFVETGSCFMWLHTHAADGIIHIEAPKLMTFTLAQFFAVWGQTLSKTEVGPAKGKVTTFYDGKVWTGNPGSIPLTSEVQIQLDVGKPLIAPEHIKFPKGLAPSTTMAKK